MSMDKIEHVVVLMLENRSFDSLLGWLYEKDSPSHNIPAAAPDDLFRGLQGIDLAKFENRAGNLAVKPTRGAAGFSVPTVDPGEEYEHVLQQFYDTRSPNDGQPATMRGVLSDFVRILEGRKITGADLARLASTIMQSYTPSQLPVLSQLARHYAVCDDWFASVPSQTNPNRSFLMCGTSMGMVNNGYLERDLRAAPIEKFLDMMIGDDRVDARTIFNALTEAGKDWTVFWQTSYLPTKMFTVVDIADALLGFLKILDKIPGIPHLVAELIGLLDALKQIKQDQLKYLKELSAGDLASSYTWRLFPRIQQIPNARDHFQRLPDFHARARNGTLPAFSYIEPYWSISRTTTDNELKERLISDLGNDYHPPSNLLVGEEFVKDVYTSLISNPEAWQKTLLLITFDEFVGTFDHVTSHLGPSSVSPPWGSGQAPACQDGFKFERLGARVPTILVSPYIKKGTVLRSDKPAPFDHTSVIATTMRWIGKADAVQHDFGTRAANAPTFDSVLTLDQPRTDEATLPFLDTERVTGDPLRYGESFWLQNQNGNFLSSATAKVKYVDIDPPSGTVDLLADVGISAYFPRYGKGETVAVTFVTHSPDPGPQVNDGDTVRIVSRETQLRSRNMLGAWADSTACYYYDEYIDGENAAKEGWTVQKLDPSVKPVRYGDRVYLANTSTKYRGWRLSRGGGISDNWITAVQAGGDYWTIVPAPPRVSPGSGSKRWEQAPQLIQLCASAQVDKRGLVLWGIDKNSRLCCTYQETPGGTWSQWTTDWANGGPSRMATYIAATQQSRLDSAAQIWVMGDGPTNPGLKLWSRYQTGAAGDWTDWFVWNDAPVKLAIAACRESGPYLIARLFGVDQDFQLRCNYLQNTGNWHGWSGPAWNGAPGGVRRVAAAQEGNGAIRVWIAVGTGEVYSAVQKRPGNDEWAPFQQIGRFATLPWLAASKVGDTGTQLWALEATGYLHSIHQVSTGAAWSAWDPPVNQQAGWAGSGPLAAVTAARQSRGDSRMWAVDSAGKLRSKLWQNGHWLEWSTPF